jgi:hypothetical protein
VRDRPIIFLLSPYIIIPNSPKQDHKEDQGGPIEVLGIGFGSDGEEHKDEQHGFERKSAEVGSRGQRVWGGTEEGESATYAKLQNRPKYLPRLKRDGGIGSPEMRRNIMQPIHII